MLELDQKRTEASAWSYFRVLLPVTRELLKEKYREACERMRPGVRPTNTKGEFLEMRDFYHNLMEANPTWAFKYEPRPARPPGRRQNSNPSKWKPRHLKPNHSFVEFKDLPAAPDDLVTAMREMGVTPKAFAHKG